MNIIDGFQKKYIKKLERLITISGWFLIVFYMIQIVLSILLWKFNLSNFYSKLLIFPNVKSTITTFIITAGISILAFIVMLLWGRYNYKKYAYLNRRKFPKDVTSQEIASYFDLQVEAIEKMQNDRIIDLEKTIV